MKNQENTIVTDFIDFLSFLMIFMVRKRDNEYYQTHMESQTFVRTHRRSGGSMIRRI